MTVKMALDPRTMANGSILALGVRYRAQEGEEANPTVYTHAAVKSGGFWYLTGSRAPQIAGWGAVERWLERDNRELVYVDHLTRSVRLWDREDHPATSDPIVVPEETDPATQEPSYYDLPG